MTKQITVAILMAAMLAGCQSSRQVLTKLNPLNWGSGRAAKAEVKAEAKADSLEDRLVKQAQVEVVKTGAALASARVENPASRPVEVAERTNANAAALLNQREPLDVATSQAALETARGLLSAEVTAREKAEASQAKVEAANRTLGAELDGLRADLAKLKAKADAEAANSLAMARELNNERLMKYGVAGLSVALGLLTVAYRLNIGRLQAGAGEVLAMLQAKHGDAVAATARGVLDATLHTGEQQAVCKVYSKMQRK